MYASGVKFSVALLLLSGLVPVRATAQSRPPRVYNPGVYNRTRQTMSNRAAVRAALEKKRRSSRGGLDDAQYAALRHGARGRVQIARPRARGSNACSRSDY